MSSLHDDIDPLLYSDLYEPILIQKIDLLAIWLICLATGTFFVYIDTNIWHVILGAGIEDKISLILQYLGLMSCIIYEASVLIIGLKIDSQYTLLFYMLLSITWQVNYNCYLIMFIKQSSCWFGKIYSKYCIVIIILLNIAYAINTCYYMKTLSDFTDNTIEISVLLGYSLFIITSFIEFIFNFLTIFKILIQTSKVNSSVLSSLIIKLTGVFTLFFLANISNTVIYGLANEFYSASFNGYLIALKLQTTYFYLNKVRKCILIYKSNENSNS